MDQLTVIKINEFTGYLVNELYQYDDATFRGCSKSKNIITKFGLSTNDYLYAYYKNEEWTICDEKITRTAKLIIKDDCVRNIYKSKPVEYESAPVLLELTDDEKFKDTIGKPFEIEVRGERQYENCYFKVQDLEKAFEMPNLSKTIICEGSTYEKNFHYKNFLCSKNVNMFLTYAGVIKVINSSKSGNAKQFQNWAAKKLFIIQIGEDNEKEILASELLGLNIKTIRDAFKRNVNKTPVVYLYSIGSYKKLIDNSYNEESILCRYGYTDDICKA